MEIKLNSNVKKKYVRYMELKKVKIGFGASIRFVFAPGHASWHSLPVKCSLDKSSSSINQSREREREREREGGGGGGSSSLQEQKKYWTWESNSGSLAHLHAERTRFRPSIATYCTLEVRGGLPLSYRSNDWMLL